MTDNVGSAKVGSAKVGSAKVGSAKVGSAKVGSAKVGSAKVGSATFTAQNAQAIAQHIETRSRMGFAYSLSDYDLEDRPERVELVAIAMGVLTDH